MGETTAFFWSKWSAFSSISELQISVKEQGIDQYRRLLIFVCSPCLDLVLHKQAETEARLLIKIANAQFLILC